MPGRPGEVDCNKRPVRAGARLPAPTDTALGYSWLTEPPAAVIFSTALPEKRWALTWSATDSEPSPSTLTGFLRRTAPAPAMSSGPISPPSGKSRSRSPTFTTWYSTRNRLRKPLSFGSRMCRGLWPPSEAGRAVLARLGSFGASPGGLALAALAATDAGLRGLGPAGRPQVVQPDDL